MTAITPRIVIGRISQRTTRTRAARAHARVVFPRPPTYVVLCATVAVLNIVGLVMILSASSVAALSDYGSSWYFFNRQLAWALFGALAFVIASRIDYHAWRRIAPYVLVVTVVLLVVVLVPGIGIVVDGSRRWLGTGPLRVQPSEIAKIALLLFGADVLARRADSLADWRAWSPVLVVGGVLCGARDARARPRLDDRARADRGVAAPRGGRAHEALHRARDDRRRARPRSSRSRRRTGGPACSRSCTRGRTRATPATRSRSR